MTLIESIILEYKKFATYKSFVSSNVKAFGYDKKEEVLQIKFKGGGVYNYYEFPYSEYIRFKRAKSKGKFVWKNIRDYYDYERVN